MTTLDTLDASASAVVERPAPPLPAPIIEARAAIASATADYVAIPDAALERPWTWRDVENEVRYGIYRAAETVEAGSAELEANLDEVLTRMSATIVSEAKSARAAAEAGPPLQTGRGFSVRLSGQAIASARSDRAGIRR